MLALFLSICIVYAIPLIYFQTYRLFDKLLNKGSLLQLVTAIVVLVGFVPELIERDGAWALFFVFALAAVFMLFEHSSRFKSSKASLVALGIGLAIHAAFDGIGLAKENTNTSLTLAILLHRIPASLGVWVFLTPRYGSAKAWKLLHVIVGATLVGFFVYRIFEAKFASSSWQENIDYLIAAGLLHFGSHLLWHKRKIVVDAGNSFASKFYLKKR